LKIKAENYRNSIAVSLAVSVVTLVLVLIFATPRVLNNDDFIIHGITSGAYGMPSAVTVHTNVILAYLLTIMQSAVPAMNWFSAVEILILFFAFFLFSLLIFDKSRSFSGFLSVLILQLSLAPHFYIELHNSKLLPLVSFCSLLSIFHFSCMKKRMPVVVGITVAVLSSFIRLYAFLIGAAIAAAVILPHLIRDGKTNDGFSVTEIFKVKKVPVLILSFTAVAVFALSFVDSFVIRRMEGATEYREYNTARGIVSDFSLPDYYENIEKFNDIGISANDYALLEEWNFADLKKFDKNTLYAVSDIRENRSLAEAFGDVKKEILREVLLPFYQITLLFSLLGIVFSDKKERISAVIAPIMYILAILSMSLIGRVTHWLMSGVAGCVFACSIYVLAGEKEERIKNTALKVFLTALVLAVSLYMNFASLNVNRDEFNTRAADIYTMLGERSDELYLMDHATQPAVEIHRIYPALKPLPFGIYGNCYALGGWDTMSPAKNSILRRYGVESSYDMLFKNENVFLCDTKKYGEKLIFIRENYSENVNMSLYDVVGGFYIFAFSDIIYPIGKETGYEVVEAVLEPDQIIPDLVYVGISMAGDNDAIKSVYIKITASGKERYYRARLIKTDNGFAAVMSMPNEENLFYADATAEVIINTSDGYKTIAQTDFK